MARVGNSGPLLLGEDFAVEIGRHANEFGDHRLDLADAPALLVNLKALQPNKSIPRLHFTPLQDTDHTNQPRDDEEDEEGKLPLPYAPAGHEEKKAEVSRSGAGPQAAGSKA
jgi:hypothetical protein